MAGASGFGAFAGGLWNGAANVMQLANAYQQFQIGQAYADAADKTAAAQGEQGKPNADQQGGVGTPEQSQSTPSDTTTTSGPASPAPVKQEALPSLVGSTPKPKTRSEEIWYQQGQSDAAIRQREETAATGAETPLGQPPTPAAAPKAPDPSAPVGPGQPVPGALARMGQVLGIGQGNVTPPPGGAYGSSPQTAPGGAYQDQTPTAALMRPTGQDYVPAPSVAPAAAPTAAPAPTVPAPAAPTTAVGPSMSAPMPMSSNTVPTTPADRIMAAMQAGRAQAQAGPSAAAIGAAGGQTASNADAVSPEVSAALERAKATGQPVPVGNTGLRAMPNGGLDNVPSPAFGGVSAPPPAKPIATDVVNSATAQAGHPAVAAPHPETTAQPTEAQAANRPAALAPVPVTAKASPVAPSQQSNTQSSEQTPAYSPPVSTVAWNKISPTAQQILIKAAREDGQGLVSPQQLAQTWGREGGFRYDNVPDGSAGEKGPFQIKPGTANMIGAGDIDTSTFEGGARVAARYYAHIAQVGAGPAFSMKQSLAYMTGEHGLLPWSQLTPGQRSSMSEMYPGLDPSRDYTPGGSTHTDQQIQNAVINAGNHFGPDGALHAIMNTTPADIPLSQKWRVAEAAVTRAMIMSGHPEGVQHVQEWFAQQSHQGALSNLYAGFQAMQGGSPETAAQYLAKAHAFFPDGSMAEFGVDDKHNVWAQLKNEHTNEKVGTPFQVTPQALQQEMMRLLHPTSFIEKLQEFQLKNSEIAMHYAQAGYYQQRPGLQEDAIKERGREADQRAGIALGAQQSAAADRQQRMQQQQQSHQDNLDTQDQTERFHVDTQVQKDPYYAGDPNTGAPPVGTALQQELEQKLRYSTRAGGSQLGSGVARKYAAAIEKGDMELRQEPNANGNYGVYNKGDPKDAKAKGALSKELGDQLINLLRPGAAPMLPKAKQDAAIGAGAGSPQAASAPGAGVYGGIPTVPLPQQPAMVG